VPGQCVRLRWAAGEHVRRQLLEPGGAREPRELVAGLLGEGLLHNVCGGWAPDTAGLLHNVQGVA
jgi:hypothetical protein